MARLDSFDASDQIMKVIDLTSTQTFTVTAIRTGQLKDDIPIIILDTEETFNSRKRLILYYEESNQIISDITTDDILKYVYVTGNTLGPLKYNATKDLIEDAT